jgi:hypothetical protein
MSEKTLERVLETLVVGFAVFLLLVWLDRISNTSYFRNNCIALFGISVLVIAPAFSALYHLVRWVSTRQERSTATTKSVVSA